MRDVADPMALFDFSSFVVVQYFFFINLFVFNREYFFVKTLLDFVSI